MAVIKCKMCGGDLDLVEGQSVAECEYCGSRQTVPVADNEKKLTLFARANRLRVSCEFDKAAGIYESIVADFPEEAEAYWGLVLCKYGIEYVDDPATGKKIPTCHRSSFDSIMDDANFEQALENADAVARKVYREEAKQIEEIRKGIIAVSSNEQPYDIFICYKETDENGERTLDSVLAQDIYETLVSRDYRTFFARITLEDKLGMEYEPYIFAALNSAKIMLAIGTDYEYYNAVWVKNEWSRYLKLMTQDKTKHLIPCYKGIDAYDMPKEFARLQAQDLGKVGAMQDLIRGIEKILPKKNTSVIQERVAVGGGGDNKIASLLDRGNMALEDGDWVKADSFFEDVLNNDSKNAQAYIGKTLAQERCRTMDAFVRKRKGLYETVKGQKLSLEPHTKHIEEMAIQCQVPDYLTAEEIQNLYQFDLHFHSDVEERRQQYQKEVAYWANHKLLSRAEKFAAGAVAENLQREKKALFAALSEQVKKAEATETGHKKSVQERYAQHIAQMDAMVAQLHQEATARRDNDYHDWIGKVKNSTDVKVLRSAEAFFLAQGDYQKCSALAAHCHKRIADITAEQDRIAAEEKAAEEAEAEKRRIAEKRIAKKQKKAFIAKTVLTMAMISVLAVSGLFAYLYTLQKAAQDRLEQNYSEAVSLLEDGQYNAAITKLLALGSFKDSGNLAISAATMQKEQENAQEAEMEAQYLAAKDLLAAEKFDEAIAIFKDLSSLSKNYKDSKNLVTEAENLKRYTTFTRLVDSGAYVEAAEYWESECDEHFVELDYKDISDYYYYAVALSNYFVGNPIYLDGTIVYLEEKVSPEFKNTSEILANLKMVQSSIFGTYEDPTEVSLTSSIATLQFDKDQYQFKLGSTGNDIGTIAWVFENGKLAYGIGQSNTWNLRFTSDGNKMIVTANDDGSNYTLWLGTYIKNS